MTSTTPQIAELLAPASWRMVDFISDLHLQASEPKTVQAWAYYMSHTQADAIFILGDLFEVWIGDDVLGSTPPGFEDSCMSVLRQASQHHAVHVMHGNRDFLLGTSFARTCGVHLLADPTTLAFGQQRWLLTHGDALCLDDTDYLQFRTQVRSPGWQQDFLAKPLAERRDVAHGLRTQSEARKRSGASYADVDEQEARRWLQAADARVLIHGHTHRPADHALGPDARRHVLSDWDAAATPARTEVLRLSLTESTGHVRVQRLNSQDAS